MMTILLWRCPLCGTDDALKYTVRYFRPDHLSCSHCGALWEVRRVIGEDYQLKVIEGRDAPVGLELPLAEWYDRLKGGFKFVPIDGHALAVADGEQVYAQCDDVPLIVRVGNPLLADHTGREAPLGPLPEELTPKWETLGPGQLYFTNERLVWEGADQGYDFWWKNVYAAFTWFVEIYGIMYGTTTFRFRVPGQSVLKWLTYSGELIKQIQDSVGHPIRVSHY
jgi:hypothetical protein